MGKRKVLEKRRNSKNKSVRGRNKSVKEGGKTKQKLLYNYLLKLMCVECVNYVSPFKLKKASLSFSKAISFSI